MINQQVTFFQGRQYTYQGPVYKGVIIEEVNHPHHRNVVKVRIQEVTHSDNGRFKVGNVHEVNSDYLTINR